MADGLDDAGIANRLLCALPPAVLHRLKEDFATIELPSGLVVSQPDQPLQNITFVNRGMISFIKTMQDGRTAEVGGIGIEGALGVSSLFEFGHPVMDAVVQIPGEALCISRRVLRQEMDRSPVLNRLLGHYIHWLVGQLAQVSACNRLHGLKERLCRWLLSAQDNARADRFAVTHEFLALMLGVQRAGLTLIAGSLKQSGFIDYDRGYVTIADRTGLESCACECYATMQQQLDSLLRAVDR